MDSSLVSNNTIHLTHEGTTAYGLYVYYTKLVEVINNSVVVDGINGTTHYGLYFYGASTAYDGIIQNNILVTTGASTCYPIYTASVTAIGNFNIDYNCYYGPVYVGYIAAARH